MFLSYYKGRSSISEVLDLPNRVYIGLLNLKQKQMMNGGIEKLANEDVEEEISELMEP